MIQAIRDTFALVWGNFRRTYLLMWVLRPFLIFLITLNSIVTRQRMSHENGLVARGKVRIFDELEIPDTDFFKPGETWDCRLRHASVSFLDDAALVVRAGSLKFADAPIDSPFDMLMNNGVATPFWNMDTFWQFMRARMKGGRAHLIKYFERNPRCYMNVREALRFDPSSFAGLHYYSQIPLEFKAIDGQRRYAKFRLVPWDLSAPEDGIPTEEQLQTPWFQEAVSHETRSPNYLKDEYRERVSEGPVRYRFQIQILDWEDSFQREYELNSLYPWNEEKYPWNDLAEVSITDTLDYHEGNECLFTLRHLPSVLRTIAPKNVIDGPSIDYLRLGGWWPRRARLLMYRLFGQRKKIPDTRSATAATYADQTVSGTVSDNVYMRPCLPQKDTEQRGYMRARHLEVARGLYQYLHGYIFTEATRTGESWTPLPWYQRVFGFYSADPLREFKKPVPVPLPPFIRKLSPDEQYSPYISGRLYTIIGASVLSSILSFFEEWLVKWKGLAIYRHLFFGYRNKPIAMKHWREDKEFARQRLSGLNPVFIKRFTKVPDNFPVTDELLSGLMDDGETIASAIRKKRLYVCDYKILEGITVAKGRYLTHPIALFYAGDSGTLMPVAIQLFQSPEDGPIFTPEDEKWLWLTVKAYTQSADAQVHEVVEHLLHGHLIVEVFDIAMHRTLPDAHPINKMLMPHLEYTMAVNESARTKMLAPGGPIDRTMAVGAQGAIELMGRAWWEQWDFSAQSIPDDLNDRGVGDAKALPRYYWRDDATALWEIIERYVTAMVDHFYETDKDVIEDWELQAFHKESRDELGGDVRGIPGGKKGFTSKSVLVEVLTRIIYAATAGHAAVNNGQYDYYGFIPNTPGALYAPPPRSKSEKWDEERLARAMPGFKAASIQILMVRLLSRRTEMPIGQFETRFFAGTNDVWPIVSDFRKELHDLSVNIKRRNVGLDMPYTYLDPDQVPCSITA